MSTEDLEPPRRCAQCQRRMVVQVLPIGWTARCSRHGEISSDPAGDSLALSAPPTVAEQLAFDAEHLWHPYSSMTTPTVAHLVESAQGVRLTLATEPRSVIDAMSSWWSAVHGYRHPILDAAAHAQLRNMSHIMFGGLTHEP
ncbi:MAG: aminotransferase class III-fold pyridoxal phosphate-dependent enzyme, partial [Angustibacter sp.]